MLGYNEHLQMFEYIGEGFNSFFYSFSAAKAQLKEIHGVNILTFLN